MLYRYRRTKRRVRCRNGAPKQETETEEPIKQESQDDKLEEYSKGVQARIAKLTRKMREAERREQAALEYAKV